ncbi:MAG: HEPN domain-containing protein [Melioribacteraceae bacterium]|nr:HEPN domain-containing protein [Melioribacteraceae bacterium]
MKLNEKDRNELIKYRIEQAKETFSVIELLIDNEKYPTAFNRIYYGLFYSLLALGLKYEFETSKHQRLIGWFNKEFIHSGKIEKRFGRTLRKAYENRTIGDYDAFVEFEKDDLLELYEEMKLFIIRIEKFIF